MKRTFLRWLEAALRLPFHVSRAFLSRAVAPNKEFNTLLFHSTFRIQGPHNVKPNQTSFGTVFVMGLPKKATDTVGFAVLVTAAHVLDNIAGDAASLLIRRRNPDGGYTAYPFDIHIRDKGRAIYVKHHEADVAAMYVELPKDVPVTGLALDFLVDDQKLKDVELHPGDEVFCLGFPLAAATAGGFPLLRSGYIASYPLTPMTTVRQIALDIFLLPGNSGGPAYFCYANRRHANRMHFRPQAGLLGLVIQSDDATLPEFDDKPRRFGVILPAPFIRDLLETLSKNLPAAQ